MDDTMAASIETESQCVKSPDTESAMDPEPLPPGGAAQDAPAHGNGNELDELIKLEEELQERRRTLEDLRAVQDQQAAIRGRIEQLKGQRNSEH